MIGRRRKPRVSQRAFNRRANEILAESGGADRSDAAERVSAEILAAFERERAAIRTPAELQLEAIRTRRAREDEEWAAEREAR